MYIFSHFNKEMASYIDPDLERALANAMMKLIKEANPHLTKEAMSFKLIQACANYLHVNITGPADKNKIYIHPDNMERIDYKWVDMQKKGVKFSHDDHNIYKLIKSSDYASVFDLHKFINILKNETSFLNELLAIDGFRGDAKNYLDNLSIGNNKNVENHVQVIRKLYPMFNYPPSETIFLALIEVYTRYIKDDESKLLVLSTTENMNHEINLQPIMIAYENTLKEDLELVALSKLAQLKNEKKKSLKRKLRIQPKKIKEET